MILFLFIGWFFGAMMAKFLYAWKFESDVAYDFEFKKYTRIGKRIYKLESYEELR